MKNVRKFVVFYSFIILFALFAFINRQVEGKEDTSIFLPIVNTSLPVPPSNVAFQLVAGNLPTKTITEIANDGQTIYIVYKEGIIRTLDAQGDIHPETFLNISNLVTTINWEEGMMGLAFHPNYPTTPYFYVSYTSSGKKFTVGRFNVSAGNPRQADPNSWVEFFTITKPDLVHHAGDMVFGPDGYLYIATGDGGPDPTTPNNGDPLNHSQRLDVLLGKILRIDVNAGIGITPTCGSNNYSVPADNPYVGQAGCNEIWASGLRNPWRFSIDEESGLMFIGDVGEWKQEEVNIISLADGNGANFGWHCYEGTFDYTTIQPGYNSHCGVAADYVMPAFSYENGPFLSGQPCSVIGGFVYRGLQYPELQGHYLFADFCDRSFHALSPAGQNSWNYTNYGIRGEHFTTFGEGPDGEIYVGNWSPSGSNGAVYKVIVP